MSSLRTTAAIAIAAAVWSGAAAAAAPDHQEVDASVRPGDDFYRYANDAWLKATALPVGRSTYDTTAGLRAESARRVRDLIQGAAKPVSAHGRGTHPALTRKIGDYYASRIDTAAIEAKGLAPLSADLSA